MKKLLLQTVKCALCVGMMVLPLTLSAQVQSMADLNAKRVENAVPSKAQKKQQKALEKAAVKEAKGEEKRMKAEGWKPGPSMESLLVQLKDRNLKKNQKKGKFPAYFVATTTANAGSFGMAKKQATARCKAEIVQTMSTEIAGLIETAESNVELSQGQSETVAKFLDTGKQHYEQSLGRTEEVLVAYRDRADGSVEVLMSICYDAAMAKNVALQTLAEADNELAQKLAEYFDNE